MFQLHFANVLSPGSQNRAVLESALAQSLVERAGTVLPPRRASGTQWGSASALGLGRGGHSPFQGSWRTNKCPRAKLLTVASAVHPTLDSLPFSQWLYQLTFTTALRRTMKK